MTRNWQKKTWKAAKVFSIFYAAAGILLYFFQEKLLFHPTRLPAGHTFHFPVPFKEINLALTADRNLSIVQFTVPEDVCRGVVLYFHGNRQNIERYAPFASQFTRSNYEVWMMDYPGFGKTTGERSEEAIYDDAMQLYLMARARFSKDSIIIYGKSIGTGVATQLASVRDCKRVVLETPYYSVPSMMRRYAFIYPVEWMARYRFPVHRYIEHISAPVSLFHGTADRVISYQHAKRLKNIRNDIELITLKDGGHNNLADFPLFHRKLDSILRLP